MWVLCVICKWARGIFCAFLLSPSAKREWIEILKNRFKRPKYASPSAKREWIEISILEIATLVTPSPSAKREWIEIVSASLFLLSLLSLPLRRGSGLKLKERQKLLSDQSVSLCEEGVD